MISLQTNLSALNAVQNTNKSQSALGTAIRNLSSGMRINSASDDAAGQAIANRMQSQQRGLQQAQRNAGDGLSLVNTTAGALDEINNRVQRIRQLAVQGLNGTLSQSDADSIQGEINLNLKEIDRLNSTAAFNGIKTLDGSAGQIGFQVGATDREKIMLDLSAPGFSVGALGLKDLVIGGISGKVTPVNRVTGLATNMNFTNPAITVTYTPSSGAPQLMRSSADNRQYVQSTGADGKPVYYLAAVSARWDTANAAGTVAISRATSTPLYSSVNTIAARAIPAVNFQQSDGTALAATPAAHLTVDNGSYYVEQGGLYHAATLDFGSSGNVIAQVTSAPTKSSADFATLPAAVTQTPAIDTSSATLSFTDASGNSLSNARLLQSGSQYVMEVDNGGGNFQYFNAAVAAHTDETGSSSLAISAVSSSAINSFSSVNSVTGTAYVTLDPANVELRYTDVSGQSASDVLRLDGDGNYYMDAPDIGIDKTATFVTHDSSGSIMLKTLQGTGDIQIYFQAGISSTTDASTNLTTMRVSEMGDEIRLKHPDDPLATLDRALALIDSRRSQLGAIANRLESAQRLQSQSTTDYAAARSRIEDADYAQEVSAMARQQILQQAGNSVLAKAQQEPQQVLKLLQG